MHDHEDQLGEVVEETGMIDSDRDQIPHPILYFGTDVKKYDHPVFDKVPAFTQSWLLRIMYYRFYAYKYVLKSDLNQCLHANLRRKNLEVNFGMKWIWSAVRAMIDCDEENEQYRVMEWVYEDDFTVKKRKRSMDETSASNSIPTKIRLTAFGKKIASQLGEGAKKHNKVRKPPLDQRRDDISDNDEIIQASVASENHHLLDHPLSGGSLADHEDLKSILGNLETVLTELAFLRKENRRLSEVNRQQQLQLQSHRAQHLELHGYESHPQNSGQQQLQMDSQQAYHVDHNGVTAVENHDFVSAEGPYSETSSNSAESHGN